MSFNPTPSPTQPPTFEPIIYSNDFYFYLLFFIIMVFICPKICHRYRRRNMLRRNRIYYDIENARYNFSSRLIPMTELQNIDQCCICLDDLVIGDENVVIIDSCSHSFHRHCINEWLNVNPICPICRKNILN